MIKYGRHAKILEIIKERIIETQEELVSALKDAGYDATQATVSRDIRELKISKMTTGKGTYRYVLPKQADPASGVKFSSALIDSITTVEFAQNLVVIKTYPGLASAVAGGIDRMNLDQILGCVAGDDTIMLVSRSEESAKLISDRFQGMVK